MSTMHHQKQHSTTTANFKHQTDNNKAKDNSRNKELDITPQSHTAPAVWNQTPHNTYTPVGVTQHQHRSSTCTKTNTSLRTKTVNTPPHNSTSKYVTDSRLRTSPQGQGIFNTKQTSYLSKDSNNYGTVPPGTQGHTKTHTQRALFTYALRRYEAYRGAAANLPY